MLNGGSLDERRAFVRAHTAVEPVPFAPELRLFTVTEVTPLWRATSEWLGTFGMEVPYWSVPWAGGQALARWVLDHPEAVEGRRVLDLGSGSGLVAIAAARAGAAHVLAVDIDPLAEAACTLNAEMNGAARVEAACADLVGTDVQAELLLAGDVWYDRAFAARLLPWLTSLTKRGVRVVTGDPGRQYVPAAHRELARYEVPTPLDLESRASRTTRVLEALPLGPRPRTV
jgi:predicted nicotinamide N-methyase